MRFGVYLPTFAGRDLDVDQAARVKEFARKAEDLGFDALWVAEHFLEAPGLYGTVWMRHRDSRTIQAATGWAFSAPYEDVRLKGK